MQIRAFLRISSVSSLVFSPLLDWLDTLPNPSSQSDLYTIYKHLYQPGNGKSASIHELAKNIIYLALW
jgi:hypothetical protein